MGRVRVEKHRGRSQSGEHCPSGCPRPRPAPSSLRGRGRGRGSGPRAGSSRVRPRSASGPTRSCRGRFSRYARAGTPITSPRPGIIPSSTARFARWVAAAGSGDARRSAQGVGECLRALVDLRCPKRGVAEHQPCPLGWPRGKRRDGRRLHAAARSPPRRLVVVGALRQEPHQVHAGLGGPHLKKTGELALGRLEQRRPPLRVERPHAARGGRSNPRP